MEHQQHTYPLPRLHVYPNPHMPYSFLYYPWPVSLHQYADRLYLASYTSPPNEDTLFPYPEPAGSMSPSKRGMRPGQRTQRKQPLQPPFYFTVDDMLLYNAFHHDFGPLHIGHLYRFALMFHEILSEVGSRPIVFWSAADPRSTFVVCTQPLCLTLC